MISIFDMFKVGIGPSSSHTVGPMKAGKTFIDELVDSNFLIKTNRLVIDIYGSLSLTGHGHNTDIACIMGVMGYLPDNVDIERIESIIEKIKRDRKIVLAEASPEHSKTIDFNINLHMRFHKTFLPLHENGLTFRAFENGIELLKKLIIPLEEDSSLMKNTLTKLRKR